MPEMRHLLSEYDLRKRGFFESPNIAPDQTGTYCWFRGRTFLTDEIGVAWEAVGFIEVPEFTRIEPDETPRLASEAKRWRSS